MPPPKLLQDWEEEGKWKSAALAFVLLLFFFVAVVFGANLNFSRTPLQTAATVSLIPAPSTPVRKPKPEIKPEPEPKPKPKPELKKPDAADIALKKKKALKKKRKAEAEKIRKAAEEKKRKEKKRREKEARAEKERERKERERLAAEKAAENAARQAALDNIKSGHLNRIQNSIEPFLITPQNLRNADNLKVVVELNLNADGTLDGFPEVAESSGFPEYDEAAVRAVLQATPLPMPKDPELVEEFRNLKLHISPE